LPVVEAAAALSKASGVNGMISDAPPHVAVCVSTFRRPEGLRALLGSLDALVFGQAPPRVTIVIADNAPDAPAFASEAEAASSSRWPVVYVAEPRRGVASARNRALGSIPADADYVAFVDDDETVSPGWLDALLRTLATTGAQAARGPVTPVYAAPPPDWIGALRLFGSGPFVEGAQQLHASTANVLVDRRFMDRHGLVFDLGFDQTGGEDAELFERLQRAGGRIVASADAEVFDMIPQHRMTFAWGWRRKLRQGGTLTRIALLRGRGRVLRAAKGVGAIGYGAALVAAGAFSPTRRKRGLFEIARGLGMMGGFIGFTKQEYGTEIVLRERRKASE
jgi:glycosyltransferase involved in cell wall biosynthesis